MVLWKQFGVLVTKPQKDIFTQSSSEVLHFFGFTVRNETSPLVVTDIAFPSETVESRYQVIVGPHCELQALDNAHVVRLP
jgi:hypothetical protein